ncbi:MAG: FUSC family protein [Thomasclavelia spiroformis]
MKFYNTLQLDPIILKKYIKEAQTTKEKKYYLFAIIIRALLLVAFSIIYISILTTFFGQKNSSMAVVLFCALLSIRFVDFGYKIAHSLISLAIIFIILLISPLLMQNISPFLGLIVNFFSILTILVLSCKKPEMGNGGLYIFGYVFLSGTQIGTAVFYQRAQMTFIGYLTLASVLYIKHRHKHKNISLSHVLNSFNIYNQKNQWQIQIAFTMSTLFFIGNFLNLNHFMWIGFACSSLLTSYPINIHDRLINRALGVFIGSFLFAIITPIIPHSFTTLYGPISGLCLGFSSSYRSKTIFNCFGALLMASSIYGIKEAIYLRIVNNLIGLIFGYIFFQVFQKFFVQYYLPKSEIVSR